MPEPQSLFDAPQRAPQLQPYRDGLREHELRLPRCSACGRWNWYPAASGACCAGARHEWVPLAPGASLFSFTHVERPLLPGVTAPYSVGLVSPDDAPACRVVARLEVPGPQLRIGMRLRLAFAGEGDASFPYYLPGAMR